MRSTRTRSMMIAILCAPFLLLPTGCAGNGDATVKTLHSEIEELSRELDEATLALEVSETLNSQLEASNNDLLTRITRLESETQKEMENLQILRDQDSAVSSRRMRELNAQLGSLREEIEARRALSERKDEELTNAVHSIDQLSSSNEALRKQLTAIEREKTALTSELHTSKTYRARATMLLAIIAVAGVIVAFLSRNARTRRSQTDVLLQMQTTRNRREA